ncbi:MAG: manganese efflux pump MntP family protein [Bacteroidales bacterium]|nr:manganese efflux pump MntP family protein [Bacteroidales bacterium]
MGFFSLLLLALSLAMDCFAVSCSAGVTQPNLKTRNILFFAFCFGFFQALMPLLGWLGGELIVGYLGRFTNWVAFAILAFIGGKMIYEGIFLKDEESKIDMTKFSMVMLLSIATSIDALAVGFSFSMMEDVRIGLALTLIGIVSFVFSLVGYHLTRHLRKHIKAHVAEIIGGVILVGLGIKILLKL